MLSLRVCLLFCIKVPSWKKYIFHSLMNKLLPYDRYFGKWKSMVREISNFFKLNFCIVLKQEKCVMKWFRRWRCTDYGVQILLCISFYYATDVLPIQAAEILLTLTTWQRRCFESEDGLPNSTLRCCH